MPSMIGEKPVVIGGVDCHADTHEAVVLTEQGRLLATARFDTTTAGYQALLEWLRHYGRISAVGVEGSGSHGAALTRHLRSRGIKVVEVNRPHPHTRARRGKNDAIDAEAAARKVLAGECTAIPKDTTGIVEAIRQLHLARASAVQARTAALNQLDDIIVTAPDRDPAGSDGQDAGEQGSPMRQMASRYHTSGRPSPALAGRAAQHRPTDSQPQRGDRESRCGHVRLGETGSAQNVGAARCRHDPRRPNADHDRAEHRTTAR
jgi:transposase